MVPYRCCSDRHETLNASLNDTCGWRSTTSYQIFVRLLYVLNDVILTTEGRKNRIHLSQKPVKVCVVSRTSQVLRPYRFC
jgi:hypothetical protein